MSKEEILDKHTFTKMSMTKYQREDVFAAMQQYADQEKEKVAIAFSNWRQEYVNELTHEYMIYTKGSEPAILVNDESDLYQYFITNVYNK